MQGYLHIVGEKRKKKRRYFLLDLVDERLSWFSDGKRMRKAEHSIALACICGVTGHPKRKQLFSVSYRHYAEGFPETVVLSGRDAQIWVQQLTVAIESVAPQQQQQHLRVESLALSPRHTQSEMSITIPVPQQMPTFAPLSARGADSSAHVPFLFSVGPLVEEDEEEEEASSVLEIHTEED